MTIPTSLELFYMSFLSGLSFMINYNYFSPDVNNLINMQPSALFKICTWFCIICRQCNNRPLYLRLKHGLKVKKMINVLLSWIQTAWYKLWVKIFFVEYPLKCFGGIFDLTRRNFRAFKTGLKFGFFVYNCSSLRCLCSVFLFDFSEWNSTFAWLTEYRIYNYWKWEKGKYVGPLHPSNIKFSRSLYGQRLRLFVNKTRTGSL